MASWLYLVPEYKLWRRMCNRVPRSALWPSSSTTYKSHRTLLPTSYCLTPSAQRVTNRKRANAISWAKSSQSSIWLRRPWDSGTQQDSKESRSSWNWRRAERLYSTNVFILDSFLFVGEMHRFSLAIRRKRPKTIDVVAWDSEKSVW